MSIDYSSLSSSDASVQPFLIPFMKWSVAIYIIIFIIAILGRRNKEDEIKERMIKKFRFANCELLGNLDSTEKKELLLTLNNTVRNARLFKDQKLIKDVSPKNSMRSIQNKRVTFSI